MSKEYLDYCPLIPAILSHMDRNKPLCNGGGPKAPPDPPPVTAPFRADTADGNKQAQGVARNRKGLRSTILQQESGLTNTNTKLGVNAVNPNLPTNQMANTLGAGQPNRASISSMAR